MRISDWSSDVCSSDLISQRPLAFVRLQPVNLWARPPQRKPHSPPTRCGHPAVHKQECFVDSQSSRQHSTERHGAPALSLQLRMDRQEAAAPACSSGTHAEALTPLARTATDHNRRCIHERLVNQTHTPPDRLNRNARVEEKRVAKRFN